MERNEFIQNVPLLRPQMLQQAIHYVGSVDDAEDIVQEALAKLWMMRENVANEEKMQHLGSVIVKNSSITFLKRKRPVEALSFEYDKGHTQDAQLQLEEQEDRQKLSWAFSKLTDKQRTLIQMRNVENLSNAEIARVMGTSESSVRGMISKARFSLVKQVMPWFAAVCIAALFILAYSNLPGGEGEQTAETPAEYTNAPANVAEQPKTLQAKVNQENSSRIADEQTGNKPATVKPAAVNPSTVKPTAIHPSEKLVAMASEQDEQVVDAPSKEEKIEVASSAANWNEAYDLASMVFPTADKIEIASEGTAGCYVITAFAENGSSNRYSLCLNNNDEGTYTLNNIDE